MFDTRQLLFDCRLHVKLIRSVEAGTWSLLVRTMFEHVKEFLAKCDLDGSLGRLWRVVSTSWNLLCAVNDILAYASHLMSKRPLLTICDTLPSICHKMNAPSVVIGGARPLLSLRTLPLLTNCVGPSFTTIKELLEIVVLARTGATVHYGKGLIVSFLSLDDLIWRWTWTC